jgi:hypothetical protein
MNPKHKLEDLKHNIVQDIDRIKAILVESANLTSLEKGMIHVLDDLSQSLGSEAELRRETIKGYAFSIFRITTDDFKFEKSPIGQDLLNLSANLQKLSSEI